MIDKANLVTSIWQILETTEVVNKYLGEFQEDKIAIAYEDTDDTDNLPTESCFIIYSIENSVARPSENITQEKTYLKFYIGGRNSIYLLDELIKVFNGVILNNAICSYIGASSNPKSQTNQIPAFIARFEFI